MRADGSLGRASSLRKRFLICTEHPSNSEEKLMISSPRRRAHVVYICPEANKKFTCLLFTRVRACGSWQEAGGWGTTMADHRGATLAPSVIEWPALGSASRRRRLFVLFFLNYFL